MPEELTRDLIICNSKRLPTWGSTKRCECRTQRLALRKGCIPFGGDIREATIPKIFVEMTTDAIVGAGRTARQRSAALASLDAGVIKLNVVAHIEIRQAIRVDISKRNGRAERLHGNARLRGCIYESFPAFISKEVPSFVT